jgi:two-component system, NarL family, nitrate/nitrite response regulator NarL
MRTYCALSSPRQNAPNHMPRASTERNAAQSKVVDADETMAEAAVERPEPAFNEDKLIRVLVGDASPLYREGIERAVKLHPAFELTGVYDKAELLDALGIDRPDVAVIDVRALETSEAQILALAKKDTRVLFMASQPRGFDVLEAVSQGAFGYLSKDCDSQELCTAIATVARGQPYFTVTALAGLIAEIHARGNSMGPLLNKREREVLAMRARGWRSTQIGHELSIAPSTVKTHLSNIYKKLGVSGSAGAVVEAMRRGLL